MALLVRSATPFIDDYRPTLEQSLSAQLNTPVAIGSMTARWYGLRPLIELNTVRVGEGEQQLMIDRASIDIDPVGLLGIFDKDLRAGLLQASRLTVEGLALTLIREPDGRLHLEGVGALGGLPEGQAANALPRSLRLVDTRLVWLDRKTKAAPLIVPDVAISLRRNNQRLELRARLETPAGSVDAAAQLDGFLGTTEWSGESYLHVTDLDVAQLFAGYLPRYYGLQSLAINVTSWTRWKDARPVHSQGEFSLRKLRLAPTAAVARPLDIMAASAEFSIDRQDQQVLLGLKNLRVAGDRNWTARHFAVAYQHDGAGIALDLRSDYLPLSDLRRIALVRLSWPALRNALDNLEPRGDLHDVRLKLNTRQPRPDWRIEARFEQLTVNRWKQLPGMANLSGTLRGTQGVLQVALDSANSTLQLQPLFRDDLELDRVAGMVELTWADDAWRLRTDRLAADAPHLRTVSRMLLTEQPDGERFLDLQTDFRDGDARYAPRYYPVGVMGDELVSWLDRSIQHGKVTHGSALFWGDISAFPFERNRAGAFEVLFDISDVALDYHPDWPELDALAGRVHFHGNQLDIAVDRGRVLDSQITDVNAHVGSLKPVASLDISGRIDGPLSDTLQTLRSEALRERFGGFAEALQATGGTTLELDFSVPLTTADAYRLDGTLQFENAGLALPAWAFALSQIHGRLGFTNNGIQAQGIRARAMNSELRVDVRPLAGGNTRITATAMLDAADIARQLPSLPLHLADGQARFEIDVDVPPGTDADAAPVLLSVKSPLQGIAIALPAPLGKSADETRRLAVRLPLAGGGAAGQLDYGDDVSARFSADGSAVDVGFGSAGAKHQQAPGVRLTGTIPTLDTAAWQTALTTLGNQATAKLPPIDAELGFGRLELPSLPVDDASLTLQHRDGAWRGRLAATQLSGQFTVPALLSQQAVEIALDRLSFTLPITDADDPPPPVPDPAAAVDPTGWPGLRLTIDDLRVNNAGLGRLMLIARREGAGLGLQTLTLTGGSVKLDGHGSWTRGPAGPQTRLAVKLDAPALGDLLVDLGYARQLEEAPSQIEASLDWPGDPTQVHASTVSGDIALEIGAGRLAEVDPGVTRVVGLLNLNALTRRLTLDFSDFYKKGYTFDAIRGDFTLDEGKAATENLIVEGPTGRIELDGTTDLVDSSLDHRVRVTPNLDATLPIAGALAGGPLAGLAVLVAQQVVADKVDEINRFEYAVTGPWANPEIVQLDNGGTLSKILRPLRRAPATGAVPEEAVTTPPDSPVRVPPAASPPGIEPPAAAAAAADARNPLRVLLDALKAAKSTDETSPIDRD